MKWLAEKILKLLGWRFEGEVPALPKYIIVGAPHTSNWDFILFLGAISHWNIRPRYLGKHTLFDGVFGGLFRKWGGIAVDRTRPGGIVAQVAAEFDRNEEIALVVAPEGTRKPAPAWKSGFIKIADATGAPIVPAGIDAPEKLVTLGRAIEFTGDIPALMDELRAFFATAVGIDPEGMGPVHVDEETRP